jgi:tRNA-specific 2-thiouridylase
MNTQRQKVFVGMSGGVDSSVSAALLQKATPNNFEQLFGRPTPEGFSGYEVVGVFIKVWQADFLPCTWREERREAMRAAAHLGIPLFTLDLEKEYKEEVVDYMIREYGEGRVPNPDVMCNKHVKFGAFLDFAKKNGADFIATGHYARVERVQGQPLYKLLAGVDKEKDQSYFLWTLTQEQLAHTLFPVGHLQKSEVRMLAQEFGLPNAEKKDSQGLCFMGAVDMADFLKHYLNAKEGNVLNSEGETVGTHEGAMLYTLGQRHGFRTTKQHNNESPLFVVAKDIKMNTVTVGGRTVPAQIANIGKIALTQVYIRPLLREGEKFVGVARFRYRGVLHPSALTMSENSCADVQLDGITECIPPGQSIVFYREEECIGGGVVA